MDSTSAVYNKLETNSESAINAYFNAIRALHKEGDMHKYTDYIVGDASLIGRGEKDCPNQYKEESLAEAHNFFVELDTRNAEQTKEYTEMRDSVLKDLLNSNSFYSVMEGIRDPEISVAVAIAYVLFFDPEAVVYLEFLRDKWEYRGDLYKDLIFGGRWLYFCYCSEAPAGEVDWRYKKRPLTFKWEKEKAENERHKKIEEMSSQDVYDKVESLELNNKKILFLIEYSGNAKVRFGDEYKYVAGAMKYLFNYSCWFVSSMKAKPEYIVIDQNSVTVEKLQEAIDYRNHNSNVIMLELNRFVELLEKVDMSKLEENRPSITESDMEPNRTFNISFDKSQGNSLKEVFCKSNDAQLEILKVAKHISVPENFSVKDKTFVFTGFSHYGEDIIKKDGGLIKKSVTGKTDYFVIDLMYDRANDHLCEQAIALFDKGKGDQLHIITPSILKQLLGQ